MTVLSEYSTAPPPRRDLGAMVGLAMMGLARSSEAAGQEPGRPSEAASVEPSARPALSGVSEPSLTVFAARLSQLFR
jgi:hypothetical protein